MASTVTCVGEAPEHVLLMCQCQTPGEPVDRPTTTLITDSTPGTPNKKQGFADDVWDDFGVEYTMKDTPTSLPNVTTTTPESITSPPAAKPSETDPLKVRHAMVAGAVAALVFLSIVALVCFTYKHRRHNAYVQDLNTTELSMIRFRSITANETDVAADSTNGT